MEQSVEKNLRGTRELVRAHRIALDPNKSQREYFEKASRVARFAYNWGLEEWKRQYESGLRPTAYKINRCLNAVKHEEFPWMAEVTSYAPEAAVMHLGHAFENFFAKRGHYPKFKKKGYSPDKFLAARKLHDKAHAVKVDGKRVQLPRLGWVKMRCPLRFQEGTILQATVARTADRWFVILTVRFTAEVPLEREERVVGVDLGLKRLATLSDGSIIPAPQPLQTYRDRLRRASREHSRKQKGSANKRKCHERLAKVHARCRNIRHDAIHKLTYRLVTDYSIIGVEHLNVAGLMKSSRLSRYMLDAGMAEFRRQLEYKAEAAGAKVLAADIWFASSKICSLCGHKNSGLLLSERLWKCACGAEHDRDVNAARNLCRLAGSSSVSACGAAAQSGSALKQELDKRSLWPTRENAG